MRDHDDWEDGPITPEIRRFIDATGRASMEERQAMVRFAPMLCRCAPWYDYQNPGPPQADCYVHTTLMFDMKGGWT